MLCGDLNGKEIQKRGEIFIRVADSLAGQQRLTQQCKATIFQLKIIIKGQLMSIVIVQSIVLGKCFELEELKLL